MKFTFTVMLSAIFFSHTACAGIMPSSANSSSAVDHAQRGMSASASVMQAKSNPLIAKDTSATKAVSVDAMNKGWGVLLKKYVSYSNGIDYAGMNKDYAVLEKFILDHAKLDLSKASDNSKQAIYINLYNAGMMYHALTYARKNGGIAKISEQNMKSRSFWGSKYSVPLMDQKLSLDQIEHGLIRGEKFQGEAFIKANKVSRLDPRIHASVNCAAVSCPRVRPVVLTEANVNKVLDQNLSAFLNDSLQFYMCGKRLEANEILKWYHSDFTKVHGKSVNTYMASFIKSPDVKGHFAKNFESKSGFKWFYNWDINSTKNVGIEKAKVKKDRAKCQK